MPYFFVYEEKQNDIIVGTLVLLSICLVILLQIQKVRQGAQQKIIYEQSYIKQSSVEFEQNKQQLTKYHIQQLHDNPKFKEWLQQSSNI